MTFNMDGPRMTVIKDGREIQRSCTITVERGNPLRPVTMEPDLLEGERAVHTVDGRCYIVQEKT